MSKGGKTASMAPEKKLRLYLRRLKRQELVRTCKIGEKEKNTSGRLVGKRIETLRVYANRKPRLASVKKKQPQSGLT